MSKTINCHSGYQMALSRISLLTLFLLFAKFAAPAFGGELVVIEKEEITKKTADGAFVGRFQTDLGKLLAEQMGRTLIVLDLPRKRFSPALKSGSGDILCGFIPPWMPGDFDWSQSFIPMADIVISVSSVPKPASIQDLKNKRIGTVLGFTYPELENELGKNFLRDDAPSIDSSLRKLMAGRFDYMTTTMSNLNEHLRLGDLSVTLNPPLIIKQFNTKCAVSKNGRVKLSELNKAIDAIVKNGEFAKLLARYRPEH
ncbi:transporter substrate-binding domain-containing protein [Undibacterium sp. RTI2.1]|uniref:substrate-binding periplasmic protein n=1 Tax=unclassified Undibacterium TaxID=2630295 RepID=UPI002B2394D4|nr:MULTISPECIES: transporter substrate-binding domain-containing protein [unclassified Undibacterium]MEB0029708.1 transporter substrate-binding domain-containing protein [Undibacterium sp. RTI2.1]MEB0117500.1 transporter substrate-binding domain-containing protein [Undibacterium sp. RTI2.2]